MTHWPLVPILFCTYAHSAARTEYAIRAVCGIKTYLDYPNLAFYLADAGSPAEHSGRILERLGLHMPILGDHNVTRTPGANWNAGIQEILNHADVYLRMEDDFELQNKIDLRPYVEVLYDRKDVGMMRLGLLPIDLIMTTAGYNGRIYQHMHKNVPYCYSGNPGLIHRRFHEDYGYYDETVGPGDCEVEMDWHVRDTEGPAIWRPNELGDYGVFAHIGEEQSY